MKKKGRMCWAPRWANGLVDLTDNMPYDSDLYLGYVGIGDSVTTAIMDTGGARSMCDTETAAKLGIKWKVAEGGKYGTYIGVGGVATGYQGAAIEPV